MEGKRRKVEQIPPFRFSLADGETGEGPLKWHRQSLQMSI